MSATDFFLVERAAQIQRLRQSKTDNPIRVPGRFSRIGYSPRAMDFFRALDEISRIPLEEKRKKKWLERLRERGASLLGRAAAEPAKGDEPLLNSDARTAVETFEKHVVPILLDDDETAHPVAEALVGAILCDSENYFGLKPLAFHSDEFAYEFLFPSWLNLYTALALPCSTTGKPRFSLEQVKAIFGRFQELEERGTPPDPEWVAALAFLANRLPSVAAQGFFQRLFDLRPLANQGSTATLGARLGYLQSRVDSAPQLLALIKGLIIFETVVYRDKVVATLPLGPRLPQWKPLPSFIAPQVQAIAEQPDQFAVWAELVVRVARLIESGVGLDREFSEILEAQANLNDWLGLVIPPGDARVLSKPGQRILARLIQRTQVDGQPQLAKVREYARHLAPRLDVLEKTALGFFEKQFVEQDTNRDVLLASAGSTERRRAISQKLIAGATKVGDRTRLFGQLAIAAVLDPEFDVSSLTALGRNLHVLATLEEQGFISFNQLDQLVGHLRERLPEAAAILAEPMLGITGASAPTAKIFLALSEVCMKYELTGKVDNFGLTKGAYGNLGRAGD